MIVCKQCGLDFLDDESLHRHLRIHKITIKDYYLTNYPKKDLYSKEQISFKSKYNYFNTDFLNKNNLKKYLISVPKDEGLHYLKGFLLRRKIEKNLVYAPGEFECRSLLFPSISFIHKFYGKDSYENICLDIGLTLKYNYNQELELKYNPKEIIIDSREQSPYKLNIPIKIECLDFADYCSIPNPENIFFERKEISDWAGVMSKGFDRFQREIERAKNAEAYIIVLIEAKYSDLLSINYLPHTKWIKAEAEFLLKRTRDLYLKFDNFQMVCGEKRKECIDLLNKLIKIKDIRRHDIQYLINTNKI